MWVCILDHCKPSARRGHYPGAAHCDWLYQTGQAEIGLGDLGLFRSTGATA